MHGNAQEWLDEIDPGNAAFKVARGGAYWFRPFDARAAKVWGGPPTVTHESTSFRVVPWVNSGQDPNSPSDNPLADAADASPEEVRRALRGADSSGRAGSSVFFVIRAKHHL